MKCLNCQTENKPGTKFCVKCGNSLVIKPINTNTSYQIPQQPIQTSVAKGMTVKRKTIVMIIAVIALLAGGWHFCDKANSTRAIAGQWQLTTFYDGKDMTHFKVDNAPLTITINKQGVAKMIISDGEPDNLETFVTVTNIKLIRGHAKYLLGNTAGIRVKAGSPKGVEFLNGFASNKTITRTTGDEYQFRKDSDGNLKSLLDGKIKNPIGTGSQLLKNSIVITKEPIGTMRIKVATDKTDYVEFTKKN